jgi:putative ABC transport system permease protein
MKTIDIIKESINEIRYHKVRSFLSFFSIMIGVIAIIYTLTLTYSMNYRLEKAIELNGPGAVSVDIKERWESDYKKTSLYLSIYDAYAIKNSFPELYMVSPHLTKWLEVRDVGTKFRKYEGVKGVTPEWKKRGWVYKLKGRFLNYYDLENKSKVCVIIKKGGWIKKPKWIKFYNWKDKFQDYIKHNELLGREISLGKQTFKVIGILEEPPQEQNPRTFIEIGGWQSSILVPLTTLQSLKEEYDFENEKEDAIDGINVDTGKKETIEKYKRMITELIKSRKGNSEFLTIRDYIEITKDQMADKKRDMVTVIIIGIISILAGGIGIMNVSLAAIYSRIKEIGIRRAIGASKTDIMKQFVVEAVILGFLGGIFGTLLGIIAIEYLKSKGDLNMIMFKWWMPFIAIMAAMLTGFIASIYPARVAANLDPVEALKYE